MRKFEQLGIMTPQIYLPRPDIDLKKWAVIACDQFTSQPEYWKQVEDLVGNAPSTYHLILPEVFLGKPEEQKRLQTINANMQRYLDESILQPFDGMVYIERTVAGRTRKGLVLCLDLEKYDYNKGSTSLIRATEGTIIDRLPPRIRIRENALLELPHIIVLIDDPQMSVIEPLAARKTEMKSLYQTDLMLGSGHIEGWLLDQPEMEERVVQAIQALADPEKFNEKYQLHGDHPILLFAMGDGNHSLATAKAIWEKLKPLVGMDHPARYALVEIENVHDKGLIFEPIHRVLFACKCDIPEKLTEFFGTGCKITRISSRDEMVELVQKSTSEKQRIGLISGGEYFLVQLENPPLNLPAGSIQAFLDDFMENKLAESLDYVHGEEVITGLARESCNTAFYLPGMDKNDLFKTVILDGALPRKTFSMGEAIEKRFYMESRRIR